MAFVLIVDDQADICRVLARFVKSAGHGAECLLGGQQALDYLQTHTPPDLIILDVMMPGVDGLDVLRAVRSNPRTARIPVVMFSALGESEFVERALSQGATDYWVKGSFDLSALDAGLAKYLGDQVA